MKEKLTAQQILDFVQDRFYQAVQDYAKDCPRKTLLKKCRNKFARFFIESIEGSRQAIVCLDHFATHRRTAWLLERLVRDVAAVITRYGFDFMIVTGDIFVPDDNGSLMNINLRRNKMQIIFFMRQIRSRAIPCNFSRPCLIDAS